MKEQWFLDLDGMKSGPYQTPEVMSLISEGEVLPHHRISTGLKDETWITILDWRLEQAKINKKSPYSGKEVSAIAETSPSPEPAPVHLPEPAPEVEALIPPPILKKSSAPESIYTPPKESVFDPSSLDRKVETEAPVKLETPPAPVAIEPEPKAEPSPRARVESSTSTEMFDLLQSTKNKKGQRTSETPFRRQSAFVPDPISAQTIEPEQSTHQTSSSSFSRVLLSGAAIVLLGFALGQVFQRLSPRSKTSNTEVAPPSPPSTQAALSPAPSAAPSGTPSAPKTEVIDRSTDKMIIRSKVEKKDPPIVQDKPEEKKLSDHEAEELKDLRRELQELKALKDDLHHPSHPDEEMGDPVDNEGDAAQGPQTTQSP